MNYYNYFSEIEEHFVKRRGKHMWVTPLDWHLIELWKNSGVPLNVALRGIDIAMDNYFAKQHRPNTKVNTLAYCHDSVMQEYARHLEANVGANESTVAETSPSVDDSDGPDKNTVLDLLHSRISEINSLRNKQLDGANPQALDRALGRLDEIAAAVMSQADPDLEALERDLGIVDDVLVTALRESVPEDKTNGWEEEAKAELKIYKKRLPKETFQKIREGFMRRKIHQFFGLGEMSLFRL